jgi:hypothetical protein
MLPLPAFEGTLVGMTTEPEAVFPVGDISGADLPRVVTYFVRYPEPLSLSAEESHVVRWTGRLVGYEPEATVLHLDGEKPAIYLDPALPRTMFVSIRIHRGARHFSSSAQSFDDVLQVVRRVAPPLGLPEAEMPPAATDDPYAAYTVVEMVTPLATLVEDGSWLVSRGAQPLNISLYRCLESMRRILSAHRLVERLTIPAPALERLGPTMIMGTRPADPSLGGWEGPAVVVHSNPAIAGHHGLPPPPGPNVAQRVLQFLALEELDGSLSALAELQRDAGTALFQYGDFRGAAMLSYTASEVVLDLVLAAMCWEEGLSPNEAADLFGIPLVPRVRSHFHNRLHGAWDLDKPGSELCSWRTDCVLLRHQVSHAGIRPSRQQAEASAKAHEGLGRFLNRRLLASMAKYPRTVGLLLTEGSILIEGPVTRRGREILEASSAETVREFGAWRRDLVAARLSERPAPRQDPSSAATSDTSHPRNARIVESYEIDTGTLTINASLVAPSLGTIRLPMGYLTFTATGPGLLPLDGELRETHTFGISNPEMARGIAEGLRLAADHIEGELVDQASAMQTQEVADTAGEDSNDESDKEV